MRMTFPRIVTPFLLAMVVFGTMAQAKAEDPPPEVDDARQSEQYVIQPGAEALFAEMLGKGETLPGGCALSEGKIERTAVLATYTCGDGQVALQLVHPASAPGGAVGTRRFGVTVVSGTAPAGFVDAVTEKIRARETAFAWSEVGGGNRAATRWPVWVAAGVVVALVLWAFRRRRAKRARSD